LRCVHILIRDIEKLLNYCKEKNAITSWTNLNDNFFLINDSIIIKSNNNNEFILIKNPFEETDIISKNILDTLAEKSLIDQTFIPGNNGSITYEPVTNGKLSFAQVSGLKELHL
jgi:hypothetical protein